MAARGGVQRGHGLCFERYFERNIFGIIFVVLRFRRSVSRSSDQTSRAIETDGDGLASDSSGARHGLSLVTSRPHSSGLRRGVRQYD